MNFYRIKYSKNAEKFIKKNKLIGIRFVKAFNDLNKDRSLDFSNFDIKRLKGNKENDIFRMRIGKYRAIFRIIEDEILIFVFDTDSRGDYK